MIRNCCPNLVPRSLGWIIVALLITLSPAITGCGGGQLKNEYGFSTDDRGNRSLNGLGALRKWYQQRGFKTVSTSGLTRTLDRLDVLVWTPDSFLPPSPDVCDRIERWLSEKNGRTLVYVGRDFDAAVEFWRINSQQAPVGKRLRYYREEMLARSDLDRKKASIAEPVFARWFTIDPGTTVTRVEGLNGPWSEGIDTSQLQLTMGVEYRQPNEQSDRNTGNASSTPTITLPTFGNRAAKDTATEEYFESSWQQVPEHRVLLESDDGRTIVSELHRSVWGDSKIIVVANGGFLLNGGLVPREHRKLAAKLIDSCGDSGTVGFLVTDDRGPRVTDGEANTRGNGLEIFLAWPINIIIMHAIFLGIVYCMSMLPIFGRPREIPNRELSDFGQHIEAVGNLLMKRGDNVFARQWIAEYFRAVRKDPMSPWALPNSPSTSASAPPPTTPPNPIPVPTLPSNLNPNDRNRPIPPN